jgi:hypothetical protein
LISIVQHITNLANTRHASVISSSPKTTTSIKPNHPRLAPMAAPDTL